MDDALSYTLILVGIFFIILAGVQILEEIKSAQDYCKSLNETYKFNIYHFCNNSMIEKSRIFGEWVWTYKVNIPEKIDERILNSSLN